jgi:hypothetical protein
MSLSLQNLQVHKIFSSTVPLSWCKWFLLWRMWLLIQRLSTSSFSNYVTICMWWDKVL